MSVLIDTNILVYAWDSADRKKQAIAIGILQKYRNQAVLSVQNLAEFSSVMLNKGCDDHWLRQTISLYTKLMTVHSLTHKHTELAIDAVHTHRISFWDAQIWAVAKTHQVSMIMSEDGPSGQQIEGVRFHNPFA